MKAIKRNSVITLFTFLLLGITSNLVAQKNVVKVHPLSLKLGYERMLTNNISLVGTAKFLPTTFSISNVEEVADLKAQTYNFSPEMRFYFSNKEEIPTGFYLASYLKGGYTTIKTTVTSNSDTNLESKVNFKGSMLGGGAMAGWQWMMGSNRRFVMTTAIGWGINRYNLGEIDVTYEDGTQERVKFKYANVWLGLPQLQFSLGYAF